MDEPKVVVSLLNKKLFGYASWPILEILHLPVIAIQTHAVHHLPHRIILHLNRRNP